MNGAVSRATVDAAVASLFPVEHGRIVASLIQGFGDFDLAEDVTADVIALAIERWQADGVPPNPAAWILTTARRKVIDALRRRKTLGEKVRLLSVEAGTDQWHGDDGTLGPDYRLRLIFTCCHPAISPEAQIGLTLRTLGGLTTVEIARAFHVPEPVLAQRLARAKKKIRDAGIPFRIPPDHLLAERIASVMAVIYLTFNEGYAATAGDALIRVDLCQRAIELGRMLVDLLPGSAEVHGLLALMLLHDARRTARLDDGGGPVLLEHQDRTRWNQDTIAAGVALLDRALAIPRKGRKGLLRAGPYQIQAAIAALHATAPSAAATDWTQIAVLYHALCQVMPTPVVRLNGAVAEAMAHGPDAGLRLLDAQDLADTLAGHHLYHAARADLLRRLERHADAVSAYRRAIDLCALEPERRYLDGRLSESLTRSGVGDPADTAPASV